MFKTLTSKRPSLTLSVLAAFLLWTVISTPYKNSPPIRSDGVGYHVWVHAFKSFDFNFCKYKNLLEPTGSISVFNEDRSLCGIKYPPGLALLQFPFVAYWVSNDIISGYSPEQHLIVLLIGAGLLLLWSILSYQSLVLLGCSVQARLIAVPATVVGSGLLHYATYDASLSHIYSAAGLSAMLWVVIKAGQSRWSWFYLSAFTVLSWWLYLVRPTNAIVTFAVLLFSWVSSTNRTRLTVSLLWLLATATAAGLIVLYNFHVTGRFTLSSYGTEGFVEIASHASQVMLSYTRGLVLYQPIFILTALLALALRRSGFTFIFAALLALYTLLYSSWHSWALGSGFGHRGFVELSSLGVLVLGLSLSRLPKILRLLAYSVVIASCYVTGSIMIAYWHGDYPYSDAHRADYFKAVFPPLRYEQYKLSYGVNDLKAISVSLKGKTKNERVEAVTLSLKNKGLATIYAEPSIYHPVRIGWRFIDAQGRAVTSWDYRQDISVDLPADGEINVSISIDSKKAIVGGSLQVSLVQETKFWLHDVGVEPLTVALD